MVYIKWFWLLGSLSTSCHELVVNSVGPRVVICPFQENKISLCSENPCYFFPKIPIDKLLQDKLWQQAKFGKARNLARPSHALAPGSKTLAGDLPPESAWIDAWVRVCLSIDSAHYLLNTFHWHVVNTFTWPLSSLPALLKCWQEQWHKYVTPMFPWLRSFLYPKPSPKIDGDRWRCVHLAPLEIVCAWLTDLMHDQVDARPSA